MKVILNISVNLNIMDIGDHDACVGTIGLFLFDRERAEGRYCVVGKAIDWRSIVS
jgi:hypothetical protein